MNTVFEKSVYVVWGVLKYAERNDQNIVGVKDQPCLVSSKLDVLIDEF